MLKDGISLSGIAEKVMFKNAFENSYDDEYKIEQMTINKDDQKIIIDKKVYDKRVYLINEENKECFYLLKKIMWVGHLLFLKDGIKKM